MAEMQPCRASIVGIPKEFDMVGANKIINVFSIYIHSILG